MNGRELYEMLCEERLTEELVSPAWDDLEPREQIAWGKLGRRQSLRELKMACWAFTQAMRGIVGTFDSTKIPPAVIEDAILTERGWERKLADRLKLAGF